MKNILLSLLVAVLVLGALGVAGFAGYRYGFNQGMLSASDGNGQFFGPGFELRRMPMLDFGFQRGFGRDSFGMMGGGFGFGFPFGPLLRLLVWGLVIGVLVAVILLATRSGWRLTRTTPVSETSPPPSNVESRE